MTITQDDLRIGAALKRALELGEVGIQVAAYLDGKRIVNAYAGVADRDTGQPVVADTLFPVFSVTKGVTATALHLQAERGRLDLRDPVARHWREFARHGKAGTSVRDALSHRAGIPQMPPGCTPEHLADWDWMVHGIEEMTPLFPPGTANAYHPLIWGWIIGEIVRRTDPARRPFAQFVRQELLEPLRIVDLYLGVPPSQSYRIAKLIGGNSIPGGDPYGTMPTAVFPGSDVHNLPVIQQCCDPGAGAICTAEAMARFFGMLANGGELGGVRLLSEARVRSFTEYRDDPHSPDKVLPIPVWFGANGFWLGGEPNASTPLVGNSRNVFYSPGAGGSLAWADLDRRLGVAICHNEMDAAGQALFNNTEHPFAAIAEVVRDIAAKQAA